MTLSLDEIFSKYDIRNQDILTGGLKRSPDITDQIISLPGIVYRGIGKGTGNMARGVGAFSDKFLDEDNAISKSMETFAEAYPDTFEGIESPGKLQQAVGGMAEFTVPMVLSALNVPVGTVATFSSIMGKSYSEYEKAGVDKDRAFNAALFNAIAQTPLEMAGNLLQIGTLKNLTKAFGVTGTAGVRASKFGEALLKGVVGEGFEEYLQQYPEEISNYYAANPDVEPEEIARHVIDNLKEIHKNALEAGEIGALGGGLLAGAAGAIQTPLALADYKINKKNLLSDIETRYNNKEINDSDIENFKKQYPDMSLDLDDIKNTSIIDKIIETGSTISRSGGEVIESTAETDIPAIKDRIIAKKQEVGRTLTDQEVAQIVTEVRQKPAFKQSVEVEMPIPENKRTPIDRLRGELYGKKGKKVFEPFTTKEQKKTIEEQNQALIDTLGTRSGLPMEEFNDQKTEGRISRTERTGEELGGTVSEQGRGAEKTGAGRVFQTQETGRVKKELTPQRKAELLWNEVKDLPEANRRTRQEYIKRTLGIDIGPKFERKTPYFKQLSTKIKVQRSSDEAGNDTQYEIIAGPNKGSSVSRGTLQKNPEQYSIDETLMPSVVKKQQVEAQTGASDQLIKDLERLKKEKEAAKSVPQSTQEPAQAIKPGMVRLDKGGVRPFTEYREFKSGKNKTATTGKIEVTLSTGKKLIVKKDQIREYPSTPKLTKPLKEISVKVKAIRESTGEIIEIDDNAQDAINDIKAKRDIMNELIRCLS